MTRWWKAAGAMTVMVLAAAGLLHSRARQLTWKDVDRFAVQSAADSPSSWRAQGTLADMLNRQGQHDAAVERYRLAIALAPVEQAWQVRNSLADLHLRRGEPRLALAQLKLSLETEPDQVQTWVYLINSYMALGDYHQAWEWAGSALSYGGKPEVFERLKAEADSALRARGGSHGPR
jgi:Tfp pilus assembly protein PilF